MAYDPDIGKIVLFGGGGSQWPLPADTWLYDGSSWSPGPSTPPAMSARTGASMAYDAALHQVWINAAMGVIWTVGLLTAAVLLWRRWPQGR